MKNKLTVHMIVYNEDQWVWYAIQSVLPYVDKLIIYDTGSTDKTVDIIRSIKSAKISFSEKGRVEANTLVKLRNQQIKATTSDWFLLVDGDEVWPKKSIQELIKLLPSLPSNKIAVVVKAKIPLADLYHYQDESAGRYKLLAKVGHYNIRAYRKTSGYLWKGTYPLEAYIDSEGKSINNQDDKLVFLQSYEYWHLRHLQRSSVNPKKKLEIGSAIQAKLPEVFEHERPKGVPSPWVSFMWWEQLIAFCLTPLLSLKRFIDRHTTSIIQIIEVCSLILLIAIHLLVLTQTQFTVWPEMLSYPYLINHGYSYYGDIIHPFTPLLSYFLALVFKLIGESVISLKFVTWTLIALTDIIFCYTARSLFSKLLAWSTTGLYLLWQVFFEGNGLWFDLSVTPILLANFSLALSWFKKPSIIKAFILGFLFCTAFLVKQSAIWILLLFIFFSAYKLKKNIIHLLIPMLSGFVILLLASLGLFFFSGSGSEFVYWAFYYPFFVITKMPGYHELPSIRNLILVFFIFSPLAFSLFINKNRTFLPELFLGLIFVGGGLFFAIHRFAFFHFQPALPFLTILTTIIYNNVNKSMRPVVVGYLIIGLFFQMAYVAKNWHKPDRFVENQVLDEVNSLAKELPEETQVFMYNVPSQYFVLSKLLPSKPWADTFPWYLEMANIQNLIVDNLEKENINYVLYSPFATGKPYALGSYKPEIINDYISHKFTLKSKLDEHLWILQRK